MIEGKKIFITGGAGFIASAIIEQLVEGNQIICYDNLSRNSLQYKKMVKHPNLQVIQGDVLNGEEVKNRLEDAEFVIHCAAITGIETATRAPIETIKVNVIGSNNVFEAVQESRHCKRIICFSTSDVLGQRALNVKEDAPTIIGQAGIPRWAYTASKLTSEHLALAYHHVKKLPIVILRPFNIYGPGQVGEGAIRNFVIGALKNENLEIYGEGNQIRSWCYIDDMVEATLQAMVDPSAIGETFHIGNAQAVMTIHDLACLVIKVLRSHSSIVHKPENPADVEIRTPSTEKARVLLGFEAKIDLEQGIRKTAEYYSSTMV